MEARRLMLARIIDVETTGIDPASDAIIEIGWRDGLLTDQLTLAPGFESTLVFSVKQMPIAASAIHHIVASDLTGAPSRSETIVRIADADLLIAHNAEFEQSFLPELAAKPWVCTYKTALRLLPELDQHSNQFLRYHFGVATNREERELLVPHRAGPDAYVTALIFSRLLALSSIDELLRISALPPLFTKFSFGKHKGKPIADVPEDYFTWMDGQDFNDGVKHSIAVERARRKGGDHETTFDLAAKALTQIDSVAALADWWKAEAVNRSMHHIVSGAPLYDRLVARCAARKAALAARIDAGARHLLERLR
jgi:exodeoxyribonuclease X